MQNFIPMQENQNRSDDIKNLLKANGFLKYEMGVAIIDLSHRQPARNAISMAGGDFWESPDIFGYNMDHFIYPASVYKIFIGAEVLRRIEIGDFSLGQIVEIVSPNDVDKRSIFSLKKIVSKELLGRSHNNFSAKKIFPGDTRKLLNVGDKVSIDYLLDLMLTRSDNTASNTLIDLVGRESITEHIIYKNGWQGSEVTRKFLDRIKEDKPYRYSETTMSNARHLAEFFYLVEKEQLVSPFVSQKLKEYMLHFSRTGKQGLWRKDLYKRYYCKGGWLETNLWKHNPLSLLKSLIKRKWGVIQWSNDAGVITGENSHYVVVVMSVNKKVFPNQPFPMQKLGKIIFEYMEGHTKK